MTALAVSPTGSSPVSPTVLVLDIVVPVYNEEADLAPVASAGCTPT